MSQHLATAAFWLALGKIIWVNLLLSGDNAVVIALASRNLPARRRHGAIWIGSAAAIVLRVVLTLFAVELLTLPWLKLVGAVLLAWIGVELLAGHDERGERDVRAHASLIAAVRTILLADLVMSLDNVVAVAAAAESAPEALRPTLLVIGLALSIPLIIYGSTALITVMTRYPLIVTAGAALIGFVAGQMLISEPALERFVESALGPAQWAVPFAIAAAVVLIGTWRARKR